jgi:hypothetical protein
MLARRQPRVYCLAFSAGLNVGFDPVFRERNGIVGADLLKWFPSDLSQIDNDFSHVSASRPIRGFERIRQAIPCLLSAAFKTQAFLAAFGKAVCLLKELRGAPCYTIF